MKVPFLDLKAQYNSIKDEMDIAITDTIENTAFIGGNSLKEFNKGFAEFIGAKHTIGVGNGTDAMIIALKALGVKNGDEVILPANSFIATSEAVTAAGGKVVFVDCHPDTYSIDTTKIEEKITERTKVVIPVHLYGQPVDMEAIIKIADKYNLKILEDSAQAHGARYHGKNIGTLGDIATFSFYPGKNLGAYGDGGAIVTNNNRLAKFCKMYANHGRIGKYDHEFEGINSRLDGLQAAVLNVKLKYLDEWNIERRRIANLYRRYLSEIHEIILPIELEDTLPVYHLFVIRTKKRDELQLFLKEKDISTGIHYPIALPNLMAYNYLDYKSSDFPVSTLFQDQILSLPIFPEMKLEEIEYVIKCIRDFFIIVK